MSKFRLILRDFVIVIVVVGLAFLLNLFLQQLFDTRSLIPMIFVLGVFLVSLQTQGYMCGILASLISVLLVNYAFTYPYYEFDLLSPECVASAIVMLIVAIMTGALTTQVKRQEKMRAESEKEGMRANLLRAVSHDLRTPLTSVYGASSTIIEHYDLLEKNKKVKLLQEIQEDSQWLIRMVENLLSVTRIDGANVQVKKTPTVLEELIDAVLVKFRKRCPEQVVELEMPDDFISIPMDAMLVEQVLINMLENAVDHAKGMTRLVLRVMAQEDKAVFEIIDDGCGIAPDRLENLFTGFMGNSAPPADGNRNNMGIGLSVCSTIIKAHGGDIQAENRPEGGAVFRFVLEMERENEQ